MLVFFVRLCWQGADLDDILTENRERTGEVTGAGERLDLQGEIKEEGGCPGTQLTDYPRSYSSPEYYYPVQEVAQEKDVESRCVAQSRQFYSPAVTGPV